RIVGLKIGASQIAAARVTNNGSAELVQVARGALEPGIVVGGELRDPEKLTEALADFFRKNDLPKSNVRLGIASNRIGVRTFDLDGVVDGKQLDKALRFPAPQTVWWPRSNTTTPCASARRRRCRSRSTTPSSTTRS